MTTTSTSPAMSQNAAALITRLLAAEGQRINDLHAFIERGPIRDEDDQQLANLVAEEVAIDHALAEVARVAGIAATPVDRTCRCGRTLDSIQSLELHLSRCPSVVFEPAFPKGSPEYDAYALQVRETLTQPGAFDFILDDVFGPRA